MVEFLSGIGELLLSVIDFVIGIFEDIVFIVQVCANTLLAIPGYFSWLPPELIAIIITGCTILLIYKIAGR